MNADGLMGEGPRDLFKLILADTLAPRGAVTPLTPLWKIRRPAAPRRPPARRDRNKTASTDPKDHG